MTTAKLADGVTLEQLGAEVRAARLGEDAMSKSTMEQRAAAYVAELGARPADAKWATVICAAFAAREVARVREAQVEPLKRAIKGASDPTCEAIMEAYAATRPDAPRATLKTVTGSSLREMVADVNHKPVKRCACDSASRLFCNNSPGKMTCLCVCHKRNKSFRVTPALGRLVAPPERLSALARNVKKGPALFQCDGCGRKSWAAKDHGQFCKMPQPDTSRCEGVLRTTRKDPT